MELDMTVETQSKEFHKGMDIHYLELYFCIFEKSQGEIIWIVNILLEYAPLLQSSNI
jgi:hypothetical protein